MRDRRAHAVHVMMLRQFIVRGAAAAFACSMLIGVAGCGIKGPLRPPPKTTPPIDNPATPPATTSPALPPPSAPPERRP
jgi:predicted small lipoprotein YifL